MCHEKDYKEIMVVTEIKACSDLGVITMAVIVLHLVLLSDQEFIYKL